MSEVLRSDGSDGRRKGTLLPGTALVPGSGAKEGTAQRLKRLRKYCEDLGKTRNLPFTDPAEMLAYIAFTGLDPLEAEINKELGEKSPFHPSKVNYVNPVSGKAIRIAGFCPLELRADCARIVLPYLRPRLSSVEVTGEDGSPLFEKNKTMAKLMSNDPDVRRLMETIADKASRIAAEERAGPEES